MGETGAYNLELTRADPEVPEVINFDVSIQGNASQGLWQFDGSSGDIVTIAMDALDEGDPYLRLSSASGEELAKNDDGTPPFSQSGRPVMRIHKDITKQVRIARENFVAAMRNQMGNIITELPDA